MRLLITGFVPFGQSTKNASAEALAACPAALGAYTVTAALLPVEYDRAPEELVRLIERERPDAVLALGQASGREGISLEHTAVNVKASSSPDNRGITCRGEKIAQDGPESLSTPLPLKELAARLKAGGIPAKISYSAGSFVCNTVYYSLLRYAAENDPHLLVQFWHIPIAEEQAEDFPSGTPTMPTADVVRALRIAAEYFASL